jgi:hypothetical protein
LALHCIPGSWFALVLFIFLLLTAPHSYIPCPSQLPFSDQVYFSRLSELPVFVFQQFPSRHHTARFDMATVHGPLAPSHPSPFRNAQSVPHSRMGYHPSVSLFTASSSVQFFNFIFGRRHHPSHSPLNPPPPGTQILSTDTNMCPNYVVVLSLTCLLVLSTPPLPLTLK